MIERAPASGLPASRGTGVGVVLALEAATFVIFGVAHAGVCVFVGFGVLAEPRIVPAIVVEGLCALLLGTAAYAALTRATWAWTSATIAHAFSAAGVLLGIFAQQHAGGGTTTNAIYHRSILGVMVAGLALLQLPAIKAALGADAPSRHAEEAR